MRIAVRSSGACSSGEALRSCIRFETRSTQRASMSSPSLVPVKRAEAVEAGDAVEGPAGEKSGNGAAGEEETVHAESDTPWTASSFARLRGSILAGRTVSQEIERCMCLVSIEGERGARDGGPSGTRSRWEGRSARPICT